MHSKSWLFPPRTWNLVTPITVPHMLPRQLALPLCGWVRTHITRLCRAAMPDRIMGKQMAFLHGGRG
jgi:hypothetical protein